MSRPEALVLICYSHLDAPWKDALAGHMRVLEKQGILKVWVDSLISAGVRWEIEIQWALDSARVVVLLISPDFLGSDFILNKEIPRILERQRAGELEVVPVLVRACAWEAVPWLAEMQMLPENAVPLAAQVGHDLDAKLAKIAREVWRFVSADFPRSSFDAPLQEDLTGHGRP